MKGLERLTILRTISRKKGSEWIHKDIFRLLNKEDIWDLAYKNIDAQNLSSSKKQDNNCLDDFKKQPLNELRFSVVKEIYKPGIIKNMCFYRTEQKAPEGTLLNLFDKIVIEVIKIILVAIFEPMSYESNFGFINNKNEHSALEYFEKNFITCNNLIQGSFELSLDIISNQLLCDFLIKHIDDIRFINLIRKLLNAESKILSNKESKVSEAKKMSLKRFIFTLYINQFDEWINKFKTIHLNKKGNYIPNQQNLVKNTWLNKSLGINKNWKKQQHIFQETDEIDKKTQENTFSKNGNVNIVYVRYIEDWIVGVEGNRHLITEFKKEVENFLLKELQLNSIKLNVYSLTRGSISFLNYEIYLPRAYSTLDESKNNFIEKKSLRFEPPLRKILKKLENDGIIKSLIKGFRPISKANISFLEDYAIVSYYNSVWVSLRKYYSGITQPAKLKYIYNLLHISCAMTLAHKHKSSCTKIFKKRGTSLTVYCNSTKRKISFANNKRLSVINRKWQNPNSSLIDFNL